VELPIAATSGFHASLSNKSKALLWPRSTNAAFNSVVRSEIVSWYNCLNGGTIRPISPIPFGHVPISKLAGNNKDSIARAGRGNSDSLSIELREPRLVSITNHHV
jgi:hypothetical protein